jgi:diguanylate cyclase (GGDEF)-like protein
MKALAPLEKFSKPFWWIVGVVLVIITGLVDYITGAELSVTLFYLIPIGMAAWFAGGRAGLLLSALSAITWFVADWRSGLNYSLHSIYVWNTLIRLGFFIIISYLLARLRSEYEQVRNLAREDYVTGAVSIRYFYELAQIEISRSQRNKHPFTVAYIDLDNFKQVNDRLGHSAGDRVLREVVESVRHQIRPTDIIARLGGDEFALLLSETDQDEARQVITRIHKGLVSEMLNRRWTVTFSVGVVTFMRLPKTVDEIIRVADATMYQVKNSTKNGVNYSLN